MAVHIVQTITAPSQATSVAQMNGFTVFAMANVVGTGQIQISPDGAAWFNVGSAIVAGETQTVLAFAAQARVTGYTSGNFQIRGLYGHEGG